MPRFPWGATRLRGWQRHLLVGILVALAGQLSLSVWADGFRISAAAIVYPVLLVSLLGSSHRPVTGLVTALCVTALRAVIDLAMGYDLLSALQLEYPGGVFYLCYDILLCLLVLDRRAVPLSRLCLTFFVCDFTSNGLNFFLSNAFTLPQGSGWLVTLALLALVRSCAAWATLWAMVRYHQLLLKQTHEQRYRQLFLMTAGLKTELYFLKKDTQDIEAIMSNAYQLYERLSASKEDDALGALALSIARDVHEVKKDNLRIIRGIEAEVAEAYADEAIPLSDLLHILQVSTTQLLGAQRCDIGLDCVFQDNPAIAQHYPLLSILKNLVTNAVEAIQADSGRGTVQVLCQVAEGALVVHVSDDGPGIPQRARKLLFQVGYSTKFSPGTGAISRGVGLPAVEHLVQALGGCIQVDEAPNKGASFLVKLPLDTLTGGSHANLHH